MALHRVASHPFRQEGDFLSRHTCRSHRCYIEDRATEAGRIAAAGKVQHMIVIVIMYGDASDELREPLMNMFVVVIIMMQHDIKMPTIEDHLHLMFIADRRP